MKAIVCAAALLLAASPALRAQEKGGQASPKPVVVDIKNAQGESVGKATLTPAAHGVKITLNIKGLPPGEHSLHIHQNAKCVAPDFKSAGAHFDVPGTSKEHGHGLPAGDIPNFTLIVAADGTAHTSVISPNISLGNDERSVYSNGGTAIVIHAVASGDAASAPPRIACGVIAKPEITANK
jgi:superoxide dismutase, Cu-Zn family